MAGVWYQAKKAESVKSSVVEQGAISTQLVTLTTSPNEKCQQYHQRMPVFVLPQYRDFWFNAPSTKLSPLFNAIDQELIVVKRA
jgi:putative SOS response-associated peptidase YedK